MWWTELQEQAEQLKSLTPFVHSNAMVDPSVVMKGAVVVARGARICHGAYIEGPVVVGENCLIGNNCVIRGSTRIGNGTRIGFATELKNAVIGEDVSIGPQCFIADSKVEDQAYLGAQVRTSNHRLDRQPIQVEIEGARVETGLYKLGCLVGKGASLGIQVIILPGRIVASNSIFAPRITIANNLPTGRYRLKQTLEAF